MQFAVYCLLSGTAPSAGHTFYEYNVDEESVNGDDDDSGNGALHAISSHFVQKARYGTARYGTVWLTNSKPATGSKHNIILLYKFRFFGND